MVEFTVWNLYHENRSLNSELETKEYWNYRRYFERETTQILYDGYCSGAPRARPRLQGQGPKSIAAGSLATSLSAVSFACSGADAMRQRGNRVAASGIRGDHTISHHQSRQDHGREDLSEPFGWEGLLVTAARRRVEVSD
jgi:hypothetical protein